MQIKTFTFLSKRSQLKIEQLEFKNINLLIGLSGAGKTQILTTLYEMIDFAKGNRVIQDIGDVKAEISFQIGDKLFVWKIETEKNKILKEFLTINEVEFFSRNQEYLSIDGNTLLPVLPELSLLKVYGNYKEIKTLKDSMKHIIFSDLDRSNKRELTECSHKMISYLFHTYTIEREKFLEIKEAFINIFPYVLDIKFSYEKDENLTLKHVLYIQESNEVWVRQNELSSGMLKTLFYLTYFRMIEQETVVFIDELENGLDMNCMEEIINSILCTEHIQFILTSHHPYIINNISMNYWKIISRKGNTICTKTAQELKLGNSKHEAFFQLMNKLQYEDEI